MVLLSKTFHARASRPRSLQSHRAAWPERKTSSVALLPPLAGRSGKRGRLPAPAGVAGHRLGNILRGTIVADGAGGSVATTVAERLKEAGYLEQAAFDPGSGVE